jgi:hypothetical protein
MTMPGFTAEAALYRTAQVYRVGAVWSGEAGGQVGLAQVRAQQCTPFCAPACTADPASPTGFSRFCIDSACKQVRHPCPRLPRIPPADDCWYGHWCGLRCGRGDPIDNLDECCRTHDRCYAAHEGAPCSCDWDLVKCAFPKQIEWWKPKKALAAKSIVELFTRLIAAKAAVGECGGEEIGGGGGGAGGGSPPRPRLCAAGQRCCEPALGGGCLLCAPVGAQCP